MNVVGQLMERQLQGGGMDQDRPRSATARYAEDDDPVASLDRAELLCRKCMQQLRTRHEPTLWAGPASVGHRSAELQAAEVRSALTTNRRVCALPNLSDVNRLSNDLFA